MTSTCISCVAPIETINIAYVGIKTYKYTTKMVVQCHQQIQIDTLCRITHQPLECVNRPMIYNIVNGHFDHCQIKSHMYKLGYAYCRLTYLSNTT